MVSLQITSTCLHITIALLPSILLLGTYTFTKHHYSTLLLSLQGTWPLWLYALCLFPAPRGTCSNFSQRRHSIAFSPYEKHRVA